MAITTGRVVRVIIDADIVCAFVGSSLGSAEIFNLQFLSFDSAFARENKRLMVKYLVLAFTSRREIRVSHGDNDPGIIGVEFPRTNISPVGSAIHNDFYSITGTNIPADTEVVFDSGTLSTIVTPDLRRPYWILIAQLPTSVPAGPCMVSLRAPGWQSDRVPVIVTSGPPQTVRTLYSGRPATEPYTFVFAASPAIQAPNNGTLSADPVLTDRTTFHDFVRHCLENLLTLTEGLLRTENLEASIRFVAIFDTTQGVTIANALVRELDGALSDTLEAVRDRLNGFAGRYGEDPDMIFCISGSTTNTRASAWPTTDDASRPGVNFNYDGTTRTHRRFASIPGSAALSTGMNTTGLTALHEFGHAASDFTNGYVKDLYVDGTSPLNFVVNKKMRANTTDVIPTSFASYNGTTFQSDQNRDGLGYPSTWKSYHSALLDATRPNLMDDFWMADEPQRCQLDGLTFSWFLDRLRAKILR